MICIFERETGNPSWRHATRGSNGGSEGRVQRELVVRSAAVLGNYDYVFDWIFQQNGSIQVATGATGIAEAKAVVQATADQAVAKGALAGDAYGRYVDPNVVAVNHDHYFNFRIDLDVDGTENSLRIDRLKTQLLPEDNPRRSIWVSDPEIAKKESDAMLNINLSHPAYWRVTSANRKNHVGYPTSYQLAPGKNTNQLMSEDDYPRLRAGFIDHHLWVTPYREDERYAAGNYPTLSTPGMGLPAWTSEDRDIEDTDIVLWYTFGMHHMVRAEDWPVMPVLWHGFEIRPFDFFDHNPALDLPE
jgi:primary-amine oxidase